MEYKTKDGIKKALIKLQEKQKKEMKNKKPSMGTGRKINDIALIISYLDDYEKEFLILDELLKEAISLLRVIHKSNETILDKRFGFHGQMILVNKSIKHFLEKLKKDIK